MIRLHIEILNFAESDTFCAHVAYLASLKSFNKFSNADVKKALAEIDSQDNSEKIIAIQGIYKALEKSYNHHDLLLQVVLKIDGEVEVEPVSMTPMVFEEAQNKSSPTKIHYYHLWEPNGDNLSRIDIKSDES